MGSLTLKSMTAYGRGTKDFAYGRFTVEIQSVNRRHLEVDVNLPRSFLRFEAEVRKRVSSLISRGMVRVFISWRSEGKQPVTVTPNLALAKGLKNGWEKIAKELGLETALPIGLLLQERDLLAHEEDFGEVTGYQETLLEAVEQALAALIAMKELEGSLLSADIQERLKGLRGDLEQIKTLAGGGVEKYRLKLTQRLEELALGGVEQEERVLREVALFAEKIDITEEIVRFESHAQQCEQLLEASSEGKGKTLEFLLQEMNREINTIGSKAVDVKITSSVVKIKAELEKVREQVQNIE